MVTNGNRNFPTIAQRGALVAAGGLAIALTRVVPVHAVPMSAPMHIAGVIAGGSIEGSVIISSVLSTKRARFRIYSDAGPGSLPPAAPRPDSIAELGNVVVYIEPVTANAAISAMPPEVHPAVRQHDEVFVPHVLPVVRGTTVEFPNDDGFFHNVFSLSRGNEFNLGRYPKGSSKSKTFNTLGVVQVLCDIHSDMSAEILVLPNGFFVTPDAHGHYVLTGVPPGEYNVIGWHERIKPVIHKVRVTDGAIARADFNIPLPAAKQ